MRLRQTGSRLINCPFSATGTKVRNGSWVLQVVTGTHNHDAGLIIAHPYARRLDDDQRHLVESMYSTGAAPRDILAYLKTNTNSIAVAKTINNATLKYRQELLGGRTPIQYLFEMLREKGIFHSYQYTPDLKLSHLFFAAPSSIAMARSHSIVFLLDCTYKTNRFKLPLLDIVGVTQFNTTFYAGFAFLARETQADYEWALSQFKILFDNSSQPQVLCTDREKALMNAIKVTFTYLLITSQSNITLDCFPNRDKPLMPLAYQQEYLGKMPQGLQ